MRTVRPFDPPIQVSDSPVCDHPNPAVAGVDTTTETFTVVTYGRFSGRPKAFSFGNPEPRGFHLSCGCVVPSHWTLMRKGGRQESGGAPEPPRAWFEASYANCPERVEIHTLDGKTLLFRCGCGACPPPDPTPSEFQAKVDREWIADSLAAAR